MAGLAFVDCVALYAYINSLAYIQGRVAAGAIAQKWLKERFGIEIVAWVRNLIARHVHLHLARVLSLTVCAGEFSRRDRCSR